MRHVAVLAFVVLTAVTTLSYAAVVLPPPTATPPAGTYKSAQSVALAAPDSSSMRYTTASGTPTCANGTVYSTPINISTTRTVKAIACYTGGASAVASFAYVITIPDTTPPKVFLTAPAAGATISTGATTTKATAADPKSPLGQATSGMAGVTFKYGAGATPTTFITINDEITASPYATMWDTSTLPNGPYKLYAVARDAAGNRATSTRAVTINNALTLAASSGSIAYNTATTLSWSAQNVTSCVLSGPNVRSTALSGTQSTGTLFATATYTLTCQSTAGEQSKSVTIAVSPLVPQVGTAIFTQLVFDDIRPVTYTLAKAPNGQVGFSMWAVSCCKLDQTGFANQLAPHTGLTPSTPLKKHQLTVNSTSDGATGVQADGDTVGINLESTSVSGSATPRKDFAIVMGYTPIAANFVPVDPSYAFRSSFQLKVPRADTQGGGSMQVTSYLAFRDYVSGKWFSYGVNTFDNRGMNGGSPSPERVILDSGTGGTGAPIVISAIAAPAAQFAITDPGSASFQSTAFTDYKMFSFTIGAQQLTNAVKTINAKYALGFSEDPRNYKLVSVVLNPANYTPDGVTTHLGLSIKNYKVEIVSAPAFVPANLAKGAAVQVSKTRASNPGALAVDGTTATWWSSGGNAPQWIQIDLGNPATVQEIYLTIAQSPAGRTVHTVYGSADAVNWQPLNTFDGNTSDSQLLRYTPSTPVANIRYIRVNTTLSPSWVAWKEIEVIGWSLQSVAVAGGVGVVSGANITPTFTTDISNIVTITSAKGEASDNNTNLATTLVALTGALKELLAWLGQSDII